MDAITNFLPMWKIRELKEKVTNAIMNYTEVEAKVREATNDEQWGPHGALMNEIAQYTFQYEHYSEVMGMLWKRLLPEQKNWRSTYKSLLLLHYLVKNGAEKVVTSAREHLYDLRSLENYTYVDENGKDQGVNSNISLQKKRLKEPNFTFFLILVNKKVRHKIKELLDCVQDDDRIREERKKAKKNKEKFVGVSSDFSSFHSGVSRSSYNDSTHSYSDTGRARGLDDKEWRGNNPSLQDRISDITNKVKNIIESARETEDYTGYDDNNNDDELADSEPRQKYKDNTSDNSISISINKIQLKPSATTLKKQEPKVPRPPTPESTKQKKTANVDLFSLDDEPTKLQLDFGDFVSHNKATVSDNFANFDDFNKKIANHVSSATAQTNTNLDLLLSLGDPIQPNVSNIPVTLNSNMNLLADLSVTSATSSQTNQIPSSFTMPNLAYQFQATPAPTQPQPRSIAQSNQNKDTLWSKLGGSVDINLDNLLPHNKGIQHRPQNSGPMNAMLSNNSSQMIRSAMVSTKTTTMNQQQQSRPSFQAPLSPNRTIINSSFPTMK